MVKVTLGTIAAIALVVAVVTWAVSTTASATPVFEGVGDAELATIGVTIVDANPSSPSAHYNEGQLRRQIISGNVGTVIENSQLVTVRLTHADDEPRDYLTLAIRMDTSRVPVSEYYGPPAIVVVHSNKPVIFFVDVLTGRALASLYR